MDLDEFAPSGTFVEFSWQSFDTDGDLVGGWDAVERYELSNRYPEGRGFSAGDEAEPAQAVDA